MNSIMILAEEVANQATVVNEFEQTLLRIFILDRKSTRLNSSH